MGSEGQGGPGGCKSPEECQSYCQSNPKECQSFRPTTPIGPEDQQMMQQNIIPKTMDGQMYSQEGQIYQEGQMPPSGTFQPIIDGFQQNLQQSPDGFRPPEGFQQPPGGFQPPTDQNQLMMPSFQLDQQIPIEQEARTLEELIQQKTGQKL